ncbi:hypothetical protein KAT92_04640 [Candidatus Babeliales bacterium]|nr:hypothetical protein [Candidatus Babeliales bacterium]
MVKKKKTLPTIKPLYVKNEEGKKTNVYLDIKTYESIVKELKEYEKLKKKMKAKS